MKTKREIGNSLEIENTNTKSMDNFLFWTIDADKPRLSISNIYHSVSVKFSLALFFEKKKKIVLKTQWYKKRRWRKGKDEIDWVPFLPTTFFFFFLLSTLFPSNAFASRCFYTWIRIMRVRVFISDWTTIKSCSFHSYINRIE